MAGQLDHAGAISSDRTCLVELFDDALGDPRLVIQAPFGGKVNGLWGLALAGALRERTGVEVEVESNDDGILFRFPAAEADFPLDLVTAVGADEARERILQELPNSAVFGAQFRQNAARALLLPGQRGGKRTPFWLQRLRAKDLLQIVRQFEDFPIVAETYRDCLEEVMDWPHLEQVLHGIRSGEIQVTVVESLTPSPVAQSLLWDFISTYMYEWDAPKAERQLQTLSVSRDLLQDLLKDVNLADLLRPEAVDEVRGRLQHTAPMAQARSAEELAVLFQTLGDLTAVESRSGARWMPSAWIAQLAGAERIVLCPIPTAQGSEQRWVAAEHLAEYVAAFDSEQPTEGAKRTKRPGGYRWRGPGRAGVPPASRRLRSILTRYLAQVGPVTQAAIRARYAFPLGLARSRNWPPGRPAGGGPWQLHAWGASRGRRIRGPAHPGADAPAHPHHPAPRGAPGAVRRLCRLPGPLAASCILRRGLPGPAPCARRCSNCAPRPSSGRSGSGMCCRCGWPTMTRPSWPRSARAASWSGSAPAGWMRGGGASAFSSVARAAATWNRRRPS